MFGSIYHMTLELLKNRFFWHKPSRVCHFKQHYNECHYVTLLIGITHVFFSCFNIFTRKVYEREADRPNAHTSLEGPLQELMQLTKYVRSLFLHNLPYTNQIRSENAVKTLKYPFLH